MRTVSIKLRDLIKMTGERPKIKSKNSKIFGIQTRKNAKRFSFLVKSKETYSWPKGHITSVLYPFLDKEDMLRKRVYPLDQDVQIFCSCPAWQYWGSAFWSTEYDYNISPNEEKRSPDIRDPNGEFFLCKHALRVARYMGKEGFADLLRRFKRSSELTFADLHKDLLPVIGEFLKRKHNMSGVEIQEILMSITPETLEDVLEEYGLVVTDKNGVKLNENPTEMMFNELGKI